MSNKNKNHPFFRAKVAYYGDIFWGRMVKEDYDYKLVYNQYGGGEIIQRISTRQETPKFYYLKNGTTIYDSNFLSFKATKERYFNNKSEKKYYEAERIANNLCLTKKEEELYMGILENYRHLNGQMSKYIDEMFILILGCYERLYVSRRKNYKLNAHYSYLKLKKKIATVKLETKALPLP